MKPVKLRVDSLVEDFSIYPRCPDLDIAHIGHMTEAMQAGVEFPPLLVDQKDYRIIDGFHRRRAWCKTHGDESRILCLLKKYRDDAQRMLEATEINTKHGRNLTGADRAEAVKKLLGFNVQKFEIARVLNTTVERVEKLIAERFAEVVLGTDQTRNAEVVRGSGKRLRVETVTLKQAVLHLAGERITTKQADAIEHVGGCHQIWYPNQLILLIESDLIDTENKVMVERLRILKSVLTKFLAKF